MSVDFDAILKAFEEVTAAGSSTHHAWVKPREEVKDESLHHLLFFLKPEATATYNGVNVPEILRLVVRRLEEADVSFGAIRILGGDYLEKHNLMVEHYGVISKISKEGVAAISDAAKEKLQADYKEALDSGAEVLGGHQFLQVQREFTPLSLLTLNDNIGTNRLAGGTYAMQIKVLNKKYVLLNPFHAYQLVPYTTSGHALIAFECFSKTAWADLRGKVCGVTDPKAAEEGSIRNLLLTRKDELGLGDVDKGTNGVHMSAGALEGMVELRRFFTDHEAGQQLGYGDTAFGKLLASKGISADQVQRLASNPVFAVEGKNVSAFDLTEENDAAEAAEKLARCLGQ